MADVLSLPVLVLNRNFAPVQLTSVKRAMVLLYGGVASAVDESGETYDFDLWRMVDSRPGDDVLPIVGGNLRVPRVVFLHRYDRTPRLTVRLTRENIMLRDQHQCQYCARKPAHRTDLNIDHVLPRSRGGPDTWENLVTSCRPCNLRKGRHTPEEVNMRLIRRPFQPKWSFIAQLLLGTQPTFKEWEPFLKAS